MAWVRFGVWAGLVIGMAGCEEKGEMLTCDCSCTCDDGQQPFTQTRCEQFSEEPCCLSACDEACVIQGAFAADSTSFQCTDPIGTASPPESTP